VADDGAGITPGRDREALTERIGLAIAAERVAAVGGRLTAEPRPGGGTRVRAELPLGQITNSR
jgi:signal transduction histidine kinase